MGNYFAVNKIPHQNKAQYMIHLFDDLNTALKIQCLDINEINIVDKNPFDNDI